MDSNQLHSGQIITSCRNKWWLSIRQYRVGVFQVIDLRMACSNWLNWYREPGRTMARKKIYLHHNQTISYEHIQSTVLGKMCPRSIIQAYYILFDKKTYSCYLYSGLTNILTSLFTSHDFEWTKTRNHIRKLQEKRKRYNKRTKRKDKQRYKYICEERNAKGGLTQEISSNCIPTHVCRWCCRETGIRWLGKKSGAQMESWKMKEALTVYGTKRSKIKRARVKEEETKLNF